MKKLVSIIIPIYNVEKYIRKCLESIVNQTYKNIEIICVNDYCSDSTMNTVNEFAAKDNRIKIINRKENGGVSIARNTGTDNSKGNYIYFMDSDDWIDNTYIESMVNAIEKSGADIVINRNVMLVYNDRCEKRKPTVQEVQIKDNSYIDISKHTHGIYPSIWSKIFRRDFIEKNNIRFPNGYELEDNYFQYITFGLADKIYYINGGTYYYLQRNDSLFHKINDFCSRSFKIFGLIYDFYKTHNLFYKNIKIFYICSCFNIQDENTYNSIKEYFKKAGDYILNDEIYNEMERSLCRNILNTNSYADYINKYSQNIVISYIRSKNKKNINDKSAN